MFSPYQFHPTPHLPIAPHFHRTTHSHTPLQAKPTAPTRRQLKPKKVHRCDCTHLCKEPDGRVVSERTWFRHAEYRAADECQRRHECEGELRSKALANQLIEEKSTPQSTLSPTAPDPTRGGGWGMWVSVPGSRYVSDIEVVILGRSWCRHARYGTGRGWGWFGT